MTESDPSGGWWWNDEGQDSESVWLRGMLGTYQDLANKAISARIFGLCCGINLACPGVVGEITNALKG